jgi:hypothetical protein
MKTPNRISIAMLLAVAAFGTSVWAFAEPAKPQCSGEHGGKGKGKGAHFQKADKNGDGFLTKDEVGTERWERIKVADANNDGKVSKPELKQAHEAGKLPRGKGKPGSKA